MSKGCQIQPPTPMPVSSPEQLEHHRPALTGHCYRMLGSVTDFPKTPCRNPLLRAWKGLESFNRQSSLKTWLYRIATNVCLDALASFRQTPASSDRCAPPTVLHPALVLNRRDGEHWIEPIPDALALPPSSDPQEQALQRESIRLAFVAALQYLPPRQRAALLLTQVLGFSAEETAETLGMSISAVSSALQRARAAPSMPAMVPRPPRCSRPSSTRSWPASWMRSERYDIQSFCALLRDAT